MDAIMSKSNVSIAVLSRKWLAVTVVGLVMLGMATTVSATAEWLALCGQCVNPTIFSQSGIGTSHAVAEARIMRAEVESWCVNWQPGDKDCVTQQLATEDLNKVYRATADCSAGSITAIDGKPYALAGVWDNSDIGAGHSKWRDESGKIVGRDNASGGLSISQQWEVLCPASSKTAKTSPAKRASGAISTGNAANVRQNTPAAEFAVGQIVLAKYGSDWVRGRITKLRYSNGANGPEVSYDVSLDNGKRGTVPAGMLRAQ
jgi:hypothetical protein